MKNKHILIESRGSQWQPDDDAIGKQGRLRREVAHPLRSSSAADF